MQNDEEPISDTIKMSASQRSDRPTADISRTSNMRFQNISFEVGNTLDAEMILSSLIYTAPLWS